ncbi:MAG: hypothetical protein VB089_03010, partial [Anaerolineaceae bacterium]|nr:hypothetical protein [Anaerolineaceae bacterium]
MNSGTYQMFDGKLILRIRDRICDTPDELLSSEIFLDFFKRCIHDLSRRNSKLLQVFDHSDVSDEDVQLLVQTLRFLVRLPSNLVPNVCPGSEQFFRDRQLFNDFIEYIYNAWRHLQRLVVCDSQGDTFDQRPYRTFNSTVETLTHLIRSTYRDLQENITGNHPRIYRQVRAGAEIATIALTRDIQYPTELYKKLNNISMIRQVLIYPPLIFNPPMNKRSGAFERIDHNPLDRIDLNPEEWLCYPAKVGSLLIMIYFSNHFFELGFSLCNLFELADDEDLERKPDAIYLYGIPQDDVRAPSGNATVFYDDTENDILIGFVPGRNEFGYFGYVKKMILTLHNIKMMKMGKMPYHGAMVHIKLHNARAFNVLMMGDTGAGKSETLEALRGIASDEVEDIIIIADDMGSIDIAPDGTVLGYGTETGAFVRLDDLQPGYAFGQIDRTIIMSPNQTNARVVLPVTTYEEITKGYPVDFILYANNYEEIDEDHPII